MGENLRAHIEDALLSREVARIRSGRPSKWVSRYACAFPAYDGAVRRRGLAASWCMHGHGEPLFGAAWRGHRHGGGRSPGVRDAPRGRGRTHAGRARAFPRLWRRSPAPSRRASGSASPWTMTRIRDELGMTRALWVATASGMVCFEEPRPRCVRRLRRRCRQEWR